jgi:hypothetical protein
VDELSSTGRMNAVVPIAMKSMGREPERGELFIGDGAALRVRPAIQFAPDAQIKASQPIPALIVATEPVSFSRHESARQL